jgi:excisionase family DNA binding protein
MIDSMEKLDTNEYITAQEAAKLLGVSPRSIYTYIQAGNLDVMRVGTFFILRRSDVLSYQLKGAGRKRMGEPKWRRPSRPALKMTIKVPLLPGRQWQELDPLLEKVRTGQYSFPGMILRLLGRNQNDELQIDLIWKPAAFLQCEEARETALATLFEEVKGYLDLLDWGAMRYEECQLLLLAGI